MPRDGSGVYSRPPGTDAVADTTIDSAKYNNNVADVENDLNLPRPIVAGGTGASNAGQALTNLGVANIAVRYDAAQTLTAPQKAQARANIDVLKKNYTINGAMQVSQQNTNTVLNALGGPVYPADMFAVASSHTGACTVAQVAGLTPGGSPNRIRFIATTADTSVTAAKYVQIIHAIEGFVVADLKAGTAIAKQITLQFGVKGPAGTYGVSFGNSAANRTYVAEFTIAAGEANIDVVKTLTLTLDTTGTWIYDNGRGLDLRWSLMGGTNFQTATPNTWLAGAFYCTANQFNIMGTVNNTFELFDIGLYEGPVVPAFQPPDLATEMIKCKRYWYLASVGLQTGNAVSGGFYSVTWNHPVEMRTTPTIVMAGATQQASFNAPISENASLVSFRCTAQASAAGQAGYQAFYRLDARL